MRRPLPKCIAFVALALVAAASVQGARAQGGQSGLPGQSQLGDRGGDQPSGSDKAPTVTVGAGVTSASTTGSSGPTEGASSEAISVPPPPNARLCDAYENTPAHRGCLSVVLRQD